MVACFGSVMVFKAHVHVLKVMPKHGTSSAEIELMHGLPFLNHLCVVIYYIMVKEQKYD